MLLPGHQAGARRRCPRCAARASTWRSSSTSTAAPPASSPSRTSSRSSSATSATSTTSSDADGARLRRRRRRGRRPAQPRRLRRRDRHRAARGPVRDGRRLRDGRARAAPAGRRRGRASTGTGSPSRELDGRRVARRCRVPRRPPAGDGARPDVRPVEALSRRALAGHPTGMTVPARSRACSPASSRPPTRSTSATTSARCGSGWRCRTTHDAVLLRRRPARDHRRARPRGCCASAPASPPRSCLADGHRPGALDAVRAEPRARRTPSSAWVLECLTGFGEASRMTQFKDKSAKGGASAATRRAVHLPGAAGRRHPALPGRPGAGRRGPAPAPRADPRPRAAVQHTASARPSWCPSRYILKATAKIYDLQDPTAKMSKSASAAAGIIELLDDPRASAKKIRVGGHRHRDRDPLRPRASQAGRLQPADDLLRADRPRPCETSSKDVRRARATAT